MSVLTRHYRFLGALGVGLAVLGGGLAGGVEPARAQLFAINGFFLCYLGLMLHLTMRATPDDLRRRAKDDDEGIVLILVLAVAAVAVSLLSIFKVLARPDQDALTAGLSLLAVPLGWAMVHTLAAFRYAHLYYAGGAAPGLTFSGQTFASQNDRSQTDRDQTDPLAAEPEPWDFLYFAFGIGMTAQVSDVCTTTARMRRVVLLHSVGAFFYNTVILALAVNAGLVLGNPGS